MFENFCLHKMYKRNILYEFKFYCKAKSNNKITCGYRMNIARIAQSHPFKVYKR